MFDLFDAYETAFLRNTEGRLFYVRNWRQGYEVSDAERLKLTQILSLMYSAGFMLTMGIILLSEELGALAGLHRLVVTGVVAVLFSSLVLVGEKFVRKHCLGNRHKTETGAKFDPRPSHDWRRFARLLVAGIGSMLLAKAIWYQNAILAAIAVICLVGAVITSWRRVAPPLQEN
ncbi:hypothetical protein [Kordiimonas aestuarii]|uniref:hypothetical protein n=1 Tax=Kordiimonas aestuarii TaxID=1005925 RepID=UPI0021CEA3DA|nr:hypothetical protein [Kordiimonas aestuarii]